ncbi:HAD-IA family hydrolase [Aerococcus urinaeequi]|uniref:HAD-IA family hydrolase n=1 Tax=Aerococcus urinaeequi TaxID=51665 RepID=A0AA47J426_9LACT|nr:HAD-IA family hydrolase [Aerococcus urinaeequi]WAT25511.1 HAD-IA family hydrolase [Aerococcus urinaeequi]
MFFYYSTLFDSRFKTLQQNQYFDALFISEELGYEKPDKKFFQTIFDTMNITNRESCLMIGDSISSDILGANNAQIDSVLYSINKDIENCPATYTVNKLMDIYSLLEE